MTSLTALNDSFPRFLVRLQARDGEAAREVFRRFTTQLIALTRRRFAPAFRYKVDPEDVVQSAYKSFFLRYGEGRMEVDNRREEDGGRQLERPVGPLDPDHT